MLALLAPVKSLAGHPHREVPAEHVLGIARPRAPGIVSPDPDGPGEGVGEAGGQEAPHPDIGARSILCIRLGRRAPGASV